MSAPRQREEWMHVVTKFGGAVTMEITIEDIMTSNTAAKFVIEDSQ